MSAWSAICFAASGGTRSAWPVPIGEMAQPVVPS